MSKKSNQILIITILVLIAIGFGSVVGVIAWTIKSTPDVSKLYNYRPSEASTIYSADGKVLSSLFIENRIYVPLSKIPLDLQNALVASEDRKFYEHVGIDFWRILGAIWVDIKTGSFAQGASTITQQVARELALSQKKVLSRKLQEAYIAIQLERMYTKQEIMEMYLNQVFFGHSARGVQTAAKQYFGKDVENLTLAESAMLIGILPAPNIFSPYKNLDKAIEKRNIVLNSMVGEGYISEAKAERAKNEPVTLKNASDTIEKGLAPYFITYVREKAKEMFGSDKVFRGGLKIYTTLDSDMQKAAEETLAKAIDTENGYLPTLNQGEGHDPIQPQVALVSIDPRTGHIKSMVGGRGHDKFNRAIQSYRQPGSAFKPLVYTAALEVGYSPGDVVDDLLTYFDPGNPNPWPTNYNDKYSGPISLREGLVHSVNVASVRLIDQIKVDTAIRMAERLGFSQIVKEGSVNDRNLGFSLGGLAKGVSPLEIATAYGVFANKGIYVEPTAIIRIEDTEGHVLYEANPNKKIVLQEDVSYQITSMLRSVVSRGTGWRAQIKGRQVAGKTGTTSDSKDAWFVGYTPQIVTSVWIGEDTPRPMIYDEKDENGKYIFSENGGPRKVTSGEATQLWGEYMKKALADKPILEFERPDNIISVTIDPITGKLPNDYTPKTVTELYREGKEPTEVEQLHQAIEKVKIDTATGQLATIGCPEDQIVEYTYQIATGIRVGPATLNYTVQREGEDEPRKVTYIFKAGVPVIQINPETGVPVTDETGNYLYQYKPTEKCAEHAPESPVEAVGTGAKKIIDSIWNYFNNNNGN